MAVNRGVAPPDLETEVGKFRALTGDMEYSELDPPEAGFGSYEKFGDDEIKGFLLVADNSLNGAAYYAFLQLATSAAMTSKSVKDLDLQIDTTKRAGDLRAIAQMWLGRWDEESADIFEVFDVGGSGCGCIPELSARPVCRSGCSGFRL